jgi:hypothetical protein
MQPLAPESLVGAQPALCYGRVASGDGRFFEVESENATLCVERAASCLLDPMVGDLVLLSRDELGDAFVLAVLRRKENAPAGLTFEQDLRIHSRHGAVSLSAGTNLGLAAGREMRVLAERVELRSESNLVETGVMTLNASRFSGRIKQLKLVADRVEQIARRLTERLVETWRFVAGHEEVQTQSSRRLTAETHVEHAKNIVQTAEESINCNANRINLC